MSVLTQNNPLYQPDFPLVDTSIQACVCFNGIYDVLDKGQVWSRGYAEWFALTVAGVEPILSDPDVIAKLKSFSPIDILHDFKAKGIGSDACNVLKVPPFLIIHGTRDSMVPMKHVRQFVSILKEVSSNAVSLLEFKV